MIPSRNYPHYDRDTRPRSQPCHICARDIEHGEKCICVPSMPANGNVVVMARGFRIIKH